ncbi:AAA family ATPase [Microbacterium sp. P06]|uniref:MinD/ParA family ATP-binding protein n=1 Tax=Microbacterium sp. P06 TaxID=3366949 RepID=UPI0037457006
MTPDRHDENPPEDAEHGVLSDAGSLDSAGIGILGTATAQLRVSLPLPSDDDLDDDDDVIGDEIEIDQIPTADVILEDLPMAVSDGVDDVHDAEEVNEEASDEVESDASESSRSVFFSPAPLDDAVDLEAVDHGDHADDQPVVVEGSEAESSVDADAVSEPSTEVETPVVDAPAADAPDEASAEPGTLAESTETAPVTSPASIVSVPPVAPVTNSVPTTRREAHHTGAHQRIERDHAAERVTTREPELVLASKRLGEFDAGRESPDLLTSDRLLDPAQLTRPEPEGLWQQLVYSVSGHRINLGDGPKARARKELDRRIAAPLSGGARFVPVLSRKGGVGKTTVTALLGMALADARDDRVIAVDANPDRGTLADRISRTSSRTVRDLVRARDDVTGYGDISAIVARDETRLDVLSSDADPRVSEAFNDRDYRDVAVLAAHYYSLVLTDTGTGIVHSVMGATLDLADQLVIVAGLSVDEARLASETLTWLETNGYARQAREAVVVLNNARPGAPLVRESELEAHFRTRVRSVVRVPYDTAIGTGSAIVFRDLQPATLKAARELAAAVIAGLRAAPEAA